MGLHMRKPSVGGLPRETHGRPRRGRAGRAGGTGRARDSSQTGEPRGDGGKEYGKSEFCYFLLTWQVRRSAPLCDLNSGMPCALWRPDNGPESSS